MIKLTIKALLKVYSAMDTFFVAQEDAQEHLVGWEHKEKVKERWIAVDVDELELYDFKNGVYSEFFNGWIYDQESHAIQELITWNEMELEQ